MALKIFGITYADKTTEYTEYRNQKFSPTRWEWDAILDIIQNHISDLNDSDWLGILAHNFPRKTGITKTVLEQKIIAATLVDGPGAEQADILNLSPQLPSPIAGKYANFMEWSNAGHPGIERLICACCNICGLIYTPIATPIYAQQFITTKKIYTNFITECIIPSLALLEGPLWHFASKDAQYTRALPPEELKKLGVTHYTYIPFVLERLMMQYAANLNLKIVNLI